MISLEEHPVTRIPLIGDKAPAFHAVTTQGEIDFPRDYRGRWIIFFSHCSDFTPVCTTEFMTLATMTKDFKKLNTELVGISADTVFSHIAFIRKINELTWKNIKHAQVDFPLIADPTMEISGMYGMVHPANSGFQTVRAVFLIDPEETIRTILYYPPDTGRNMEELKRIIISLQKADAEKVATPANWGPADDDMLPAPQTCKAARERMEQVNENAYCLDWFLCFRQTGPNGDRKEELPEELPYPSSLPNRDDEDAVKK